MREPRFDVLFEPVQIGPVTARNRFFQVPHCNGMGYRDPTAHAHMRGIKAEGGWAVVCTEEVEIHASSEVAPFIEGRLDKTPQQALDLQPGELVRVKSLKEIVATLDVNNTNRGMSFDGEMVRFCGREFRVLRRVEQIIDEQTGEMIRFKNPCIVLEDVTCVGAYHRQCPRGIYPYWREIWLERVESSATDHRASASSRSDLV